MKPVDFSTLLNFSSGQLRVTLSRDFYHNCLTKDPFTHSHPMFELHYIVQGSCTVVTQKQRMDCCQGNFLLLPPHCVHRLLPHGDQVQTVSLLFAQEENTGLLSTLSSQEVCLVADVFGGFDRLQIIRQELENSRPMYAEKIQGELTALLADLFRALGRQENDAVNTEQIRVMQIDTYLMEHRFEPDCSCQALARQMHLSTRQVQRLCRQYYNAGFRQVLTSMRMEVAAHRLQNSDASVSDIAQQLGYASVSSFSAAYKHHFGRSPSQDRTLENRT